MEEDNDDDEYKKKKKMKTKKKKSKKADHWVHLKQRWALLYISPTLIFRENVKNQLD